MTKKYLHGVVTAMVTPFHTDGSVNLQAVTELTQFLIQKGITGLFPLGTNGECMRLSVAERKAVAEAVVQAAKGSNVPVFIHTGAVSLEDTIALTRHAAEIGADGVAVVTPCYFKLTDDELYIFYQTVASCVPEDFPIYVYSIPQCTTNDISAELMNKLYCNIPNIVGIKYSFLDMERTKQYCAIEGLSVLHGADTMYPEMMALGCDGVVSGLSGAYPEPFVNQVVSYTAGDNNSVLHWQNIAKEVGVLTDAGNIAQIKYVISQRGIEVGDIRLPALPPSAETKLQIQANIPVIDSKI